MEVCATRVPRAKLFQADGCEGVSRVAWCVSEPFEARPPSTTTYVQPTPQRKHTCESLPSQILNYSTIRQALRRSRDCRVSIILWSSSGSWKYCSPDPFVMGYATLLATMSQLPRGYHRRCGGCTALFVQLAHSNPQPPSP